MITTLKEHFETCYHVDQLLKVPAKDIEIWNYAKANQFIIVTNDDDFADFVSLKGFPPKVVLLKTGNQAGYFLLIFSYLERRKYNNWKLYQTRVYLK
jgi:predicted nuclease of predicted toxin-antitoxin system